VLATAVNTVKYNLNASGNNNPIEIDTYPICSTKWVVRMKPSNGKRRRCNSARARIRKLVFSLKTQGHVYPPIPGKCTA